MVDGRAKLAKLGLVVLYFKGETKKVSIDEEMIKCNECRYECIKVKNL